MNERTDETNLAKYQKLLKQDGKHWCSVAQSCLTLQSHGLQHARFPCPSPSPRVWWTLLLSNFYIFEIFYNIKFKNLIHCSSLHQSHCGIIRHWSAVLQLELLTNSGVSYRKWCNLLMSTGSGTESIDSDVDSVPKCWVFSCQCLYFPWDTTCTHKELILLKSPNSQSLPDKNVKALRKEKLCFSSVQSLSRVQLFATPWIAARQACLSITSSRSLLKLTSIKSGMPSSHLILCRPLLLLPPIPPSIRVFSTESTLHMRWPKNWSFSFSISPSNEHPGRICFTMDWLDLLAVQGTLKSLLQHHTSKASILQCSAFFTVQFCVLRFP